MGPPELKFWSQQTCVHSQIKALFDTYETVVWALRRKQQYLAYLKTHSVMHDKCSLKL